MSPKASHRVRPGLSSAASLMTTLLISFDQEVLNQHLNLVTPEYPFFESPWDKGRLGWQTAVGYGRRAFGETAMFRYKTVIGRGLRARTLPAQKTEARVGCAVLN